jgi:hypothetical protein
MSALDKIACHSQSMAACQGLNNLLYNTPSFQTHSRHGEGLEGVLVQVGHGDPCCQLQTQT